MAEPPQLWGFKKTLKFTVPLVAVGALVVYAYIPHDKMVKVSKLKGGECIMLPDKNVVRNLQQRECDKTHTGEVYAAFNYPGSTIAGEPSPSENCSRLPDGATEEEAAFYERVLGEMADTGKEQELLSNNEDETVDRSYACVLSTPDQKGRLLDQIALAADPPTTTTTGG